MVETQKSTVPVSEIPPMPAEETAFDDLLPLRDYSRYRRYGEDTFDVTIGGTTYEVSTHFSETGRQSVMEQFKILILSEQLI